MDIIAKDHPNWVCHWNDDDQIKYHPIYYYLLDKIKIDTVYSTQFQFSFVHAPQGVWEK